MGGVAGMGAGDPGGLPESPQPMNAEPTGQIDAAHPPQLVPGMTRSTVDGSGKILDFSAVPLEGVADSVPPVPYDTAFRFAHLDASTFTETTPLKPPTFRFDQL